MSNFLEAERLFPADEPGRDVSITPINLMGRDVEEIDRIASCQMGAGREICLVSVENNALRTRVLDLRGIADRPREEEERFKSSLIGAMSKAVMMFVVKEQD